MRRCHMVAIIVSTIIAAATEIISGLDDEEAYHTSPTSRSAILSSSRAERERKITAIAISSFLRELSHIIDLLCIDLDMTKTNAETREERKRLKNERLELEHL